jgi:hypothetical protein
MFGDRSLPHRRSVQDPVVRVHSPRSVDLRPLLFHPIHVGIDTFVEEAHQILDLGALRDGAG